MQAEDKMAGNGLILKQKISSGGLISFFSSLKVFVFLVLCIVATVFLFSTSKGFVNHVIQEKYGNTSQNNAEILVRELINSREAIETIAAMDNGNTTNAQINLDKFSEVIKVKFTDDNEPIIETLLTKNRETTTKHYYVSDPKKLTPVIYSRSLPKNQRLIVLTDPRLFESNGENTHSKKSSRPVAIALKGDDRQSKEFWVATINIDQFFSDYWLQENQISRVSIRDLETGKSIYNLQEEGDNKQTFSAIHEFNFTNKKWEIRTEFFSDAITQKLQYIPYLMVYFGALITIGGLMALYNSHTHAQRVINANKNLGEKNKALKREIQKRKILGRELGASEREKRAIVDAVSDIIFETNTQGKILFLNATWNKVTGFSTEQSMGTELFKMLHPQDQVEQEQDFRLLVEGKKAAYTTFTRLRTSSGTFRAIELTISMIRQDEDKNLRVVGTITDVEERDRAEKALKDAEKKYRTIVENAAGGIFQMTPEGMFLSSNLALARILGYESPEDLIKEVKDANKEIYLNQQARKKYIHELEATGTISNNETQAKRKDGSAIWINENTRTVRDEEGNVLYYEGSIEDITQRKETDFTMREAKMHSDMANRAKSEFLTNMSHELRTPLNAIIGFSEIIKDETFGKIDIPEYKDYAFDIHKSGKNLLKIINEILDISKIEANERQLQEEMVEMNPLIDDCLEILKSKITENQLIISKPHTKIPQVIAETIAVKQMLMNVLSNAIKFTPSKGHITLSHELDDDGSLRLSVTDTGIGMDPEEIPKILSPFGQTENPFSRKHGGTGLGLTLVNSLMKLHGGTLEVLSQKSIGTTVTLVFPSARILETKEKPEEKEKEKIKSIFGFGKSEKE